MDKNINLPKKRRKLLDQLIPELRKCKKYSAYSDLLRDHITRYISLNGKLDNDFHSFVHGVLNQMDAKIENLIDKTIYFIRNCPEHILEILEGYFYY